MKAYTDFPDLSDQSYESGTSDDFIAQIFALFPLQYPFPITDTA